MQPFEISAGADDLPLRTLSASGELDLATADQLLAAALAVLARPGATGLRLDLGGITFMDSVGLAVLVKIYRVVAELGVLDVSGSSVVVERLVRLAGLGDMFGVEYDPGVA